MANPAALNVASAASDASASQMEGPRGRRPKRLFSARNLVIYGTLTLAAIYYLLRRGEHSAWHRIRDAVEVWNFYAGAPLRLEVSSDGRERLSYALGRNLTAGERPQVVVPADA